MTIKEFNTRRKSGGSLPDNREGIEFENDMYIIRSYRIIWNDFVYRMTDKTITWYVHLPNMKNKTLKEAAKAIRKMRDTEG
jgi:hypothetical protein